MTIRSTFQTLAILSGFTFLTLACNGPASQETSENEDSVAMESQNADMLTLLVGTYTEGEADTEDKSEGIYVYEMNAETGELQFKNTATGIKNPSYLAVHPNNKYVYAASETSGNDTLDAGLIYAYEFNNSDKSLKMINAVSSEGTAPCYVSVTPSGKFAMTANYGNGSVALYPLDGDGKLEKASSVDQHKGNGPTDRQKSPHAHMIIPGKSSDFIYSVDLGTDQIYVYDLDASGEKLETTSKNAKVKGGTGPRHLTFHPTKDWAYVVGELGGTVTAFNLDAATGGLTSFQTISTLPEGKTKADCADIHITPSGKYLYATNRGGYNTIAMYSINQENGELTLIGFQSTKGDNPRNFVIDPSGKFLLAANQNTGNVVTFKIDDTTGKLIETEYEAKIPKPVCLKFIE